MAVFNQIIMYADFSYYVAEALEMPNRGFNIEYQIQIESAPLLIYLIFFLRSSGGSWILSRSCYVFLFFK